VTRPTCGKLYSCTASRKRLNTLCAMLMVVRLRSTTLSTAHKVFNRFRLAVQEYNFPQVGRVTVSLGFVCTTKGSPVEILGQADQALYYAKEHGRNQVCFYDDLVANGHLTAKVANDDVELF